MKNKGIAALVLAAVAVFAFLLGTFYGRLAAPSPIQVSNYPNLFSRDPTASTTPSNTEGAPEPTETAPTTKPPETEPPAPAIININTATAEELDTLPGIGPTLAERIIQYRTDNGPFATPEEICNVSGIGQKTLEEIYDRITV